jgi:hypothetical protein
MIRLIAITTLGLTLSFYSSSFALNGYNVFGVRVPIVKSGVENQVSGGSVEKDFMSFYTAPKTASETSSPTADKKLDDDKDYIVVFGVQIPRNSRL